VKSLGGQALMQAVVEPRGLAGDRRWMLTTPDGRFLTRREMPAMARIQAEWAERGIVLSHDDAGMLTVAEPLSGAERAVRVWDDVVAATDAGDVAAQWLSAVFARPVRLVHMPDAVQRPVDAGFGRAGDQVSFADGFPLLVTTVESLDELNRHLGAPITMARFRPNLVIAGALAAFAEDGWQIVRIGDVRMRVVKPCTRCVITTQDPDSGEVVEKMEPLRTLRAMGRVMPGEGRLREPIFGQNAIPDDAGVIAVGDKVEVLG
jgi:uncharacterized protein YcbX